MALTVSVVVTTFYREELLRRTLLSCMASRDVDPATVELIAVDGSPNASARDTVAEVAAEAAKRGLVVRYVHEPRPGISHARNAGIHAAASDLVAFIDDDEEADPDWLSRMLACQARYKADIVLGPVYPIFEMEHAAHDPFWRWFFTADTGLKTGDIVARGCGTHNCLVVKPVCCIDDAPFDPALGLTGGEDSRFFQTVRSRGGRLIWCHDAVISEFIPAGRTTWTFAWRRRLRENQLLLQWFLWSNPPQYFQVPLWMTIGLAQMLVYFPLALLFVGVHRPTAMKFGAKVAGGVGKLLWFPGLTLIGYGAGHRQPAAA